MIDTRLDSQTKAIDSKLENQTKELDLKFKHQTQEMVKATERHERVILEEFEHRLSVVAEVVDDHTKKLDDHTHKLNALMEMVAMNTETLEFIKSMLKRKVDLDEYEQLEKRVSLIEKKLRASGA